jgi:flagellar protein FlbD
MVNLTRLNHEAIVVNSDLIEHIETTPDTVLSMTTGQRIMVLETVDEVIERIVQFRQRIAGVSCAPGCAPGPVRA